MVIVLNDVDFGYSNSKKSEFTVRSIENYGAGLGGESASVLVRWR